MRHTLLAFGVFALLFVPALAFANTPPPPPYARYLRTPDQETDKTPAPKAVRVIENAPVSLTYRYDLKRPQIIIPQKYAVGQAAPKAEEEAAGTTPRNLFAGLALSVAFVTGGLWLVRRSGKAGKALLVLFVFSAGTFASPLVSELASNEAPPPNAKEKALDELTTQGNTAKLGVDVIIAADGERIQVILPKQLLPATMIPRGEFIK
jgi:hypothetical protein